MAEITRILRQIESGDALAADQLLPLLYDELRALAAARLAQEASGNTLQATALVHEAWLRLVSPDEPQSWDSRGHFFAAAAEAMRRILVESARRKQRIKHGGGRQRIDLDPQALSIEKPPEDLVALDEALNRFSAEDPEKARLVKLRFFAGLTMPEIAQIMGLSLATVERHWTYARTWLFAEMRDEEGQSPKI